MSSKNEPIKLEFPIQVEGAKVTELNMRRCSIGDQIAAQHNGKSDGEIEVTLLANLCGIKPDDFHQLDIKDYKKVQECYRNFLE